MPRFQPPVPEHSLPRLPRALLSALLPPAEREEVLADLAAEFDQRVARDGHGGAGRWLWRQVLLSVPALLRRSWWRARTGFEPKANAFQTGGPRVEHWMMDGRFALRRLLRRPAYSLLAIGTLALGIGGTTAVFGIARSVLFTGLPYSAPEGIGFFWAPLDWNQQEFAFLRGNTPGFSEISQYRPQAITLERGDAPARLLPAVAASHELFSVLGARPFLGRTFEPGDDVAGAEPVAVVSYGLWQDLGGDGAIIGTQLLLDGRRHTVIGVMPREFWFPSPAERVWAAQPLNPQERSGNFALVGRMAPGQRLDGLDGPLAALATRLGQQFQYPAQWDKTREPSIRSAEEVFLRPLRPAIMATLAAMAMILLIACANVSALMLGQVEGRSVELAVRSALGADRRRLTGHLIAEALMIGAGACVIGAAVASGGFRLLINQLPLGAWAETARLDWSVFMAALLFALISSLVVSLAPVLALRRHHPGTAAVRTGGVAGRGLRLESVLVIAEVALAVLMAAGAGVLGRSVARLYSIDPGLNPNGVGVVDLVLPSDLTNPERRRIMADLAATTRALPGMEQAAMVQMPPLRAPAWNTGIIVEGKPDLPVSTTLLRMASPGYLEALGATLVQGRLPVESDLLTSSSDSIAGVAVINESLARKYFDGENPVGRWITNGFGPARLQVIGVVRDVAEAGLTADPAPVRYVPPGSIPFVPQGQSLVFRTAGARDPLPDLERVRRLVQEVAPRVAVSQATTMEEEVTRAMGPVRQLLALVSILTALALLLGAIGIYGVMAHFVARRKRDWGIRIALGLRPGRAVSNVVGRGLGLVASGIALGLLAFLLLGRLLRPFVYGIGATDPAAIALAAAVLLLVGVAAALVPAARAGRTDPATVMREE